MEKNSIKILAGLLIALAFLTGFLSYYAVTNVYIDKESPFLMGFSNTNEQPSDWISTKNIEIYEDKVVIYADNPILSRYEASGSMLPTLGEDTNGIKMVPSSPEQIQIGDIISFEKDNILIVHRVIAKGSDENGDWFVTKGDNNEQTDGKVYFSQVRYVTIALIY